METEREGACSVAMISIQKTPSQGILSSNRKGVTFFLLQNLEDKKSRLKMSKEGKILHI